MINLVICISSLIVGIFLCYLDYNLKYNSYWIIRIPKWVDRHFLLIDIILSTIRIASFFMFGFFIMETIKVIMGGPTLIF